MKYMPVFTALAWSTAACPDETREPLAHHKRGRIQGGCNQAYVGKSLDVCAGAARKAAALAADSKNPLYKLFFKNEDKKSRSKVTSMFQMVADECAAKGGGRTGITCGDGGICGRGQGGITVEATTQGLHVNLCSGFFRGNDPAQSRGCANLDSAGVMLHEMTHALGKTTDQRGAYGLAAVKRLTSQQNLEHADTYAIFAHFARLGCSERDFRKGGRTRGPTGSGSGLGSSQGTSFGGGSGNNESSPSGAPTKNGNRDQGDNRISPSQTPDRLENENKGPVNNSESKEPPSGLLNGSQGGNRSQGSPKPNDDGNNQVAPPLIPDQGNPNRQTGRRS